jgi:hypothetical protein
MTAKKIEPMDSDQSSPEHGKVKQPTVRALFAERMKRDGRTKEWYATVKQVMRETGKRYGPASWEAMRRMGYEGPKRERQLHEEFLQEGHKTSLQRQMDQGREEMEADRQDEEFEQALRLLPDTAPITVEMEWIQAHPAMARKARQTDKLKRVLVTASDILAAPHGLAPSKAAVFALQQWANCPETFYRELLSQQMKAGRPEEAAPVAEDVGLEEVERLLGQVSVG